MFSVKKLPNLRCLDFFATSQICGINSKEIGNIALVRKGKY